LTFAPGTAGGQAIDNVRLEVETERISLLAFDPTGEGNEKLSIEKYRLALPKMLVQRKEAEARARAAGHSVMQGWVDPEVSGIPISEN
jgi:hypothetical protein